MIACLVPAFRDPDNPPFPLSPHSGQPMCCPIHNPDMILFGVLCEVGNQDQGEAPHAT